MMMRGCRWLPLLYPALSAILIIGATGSQCARGADWPQYGRDSSRNMVTPDERGLPATADPGPAVEGSTIPASSNIRWVTKLGSQSYGNVTVAGGRVFLGTNNAFPRDPLINGDQGILLCLSEQSGDVNWQFAVPKLRAGKVSDWEEVGLCSSPTVSGDRVYVVTNRCEVACLSVRGPVIWRYDMREELGVFPHNMTSSSILALGERLFVTTSNGVDWTAKHLPAPDAPALICLDSATGRLLARERAGISRRTFYCNWSSPASGVVNGKPIVVFGGGDGFCYAFDVEPAAPGPDGIPTLRELWRCDCNPPEYRTKDGQAIHYGQSSGPSEVIATPVIVGNRVFAAIGQEPEQGEGAGCLNCIDAGKSGDISQTGVLWRNMKIGRSLSPVSVAGDLLYLPEYSGTVHCLKAADGSELWSHDTEAHIWGGALVADGKVYVGNENGTLCILAAGDTKNLLASIDFKEAIDSSPVAANGTVYVGTLSRLYALGTGRH